MTYRTSTSLVLGGLLLAIVGLVGHFALHGPLPGLAWDAPQGPAVQAASNARLVLSPAAFQTPTPDEDCNEPAAPAAPASRELGGAEA